MFPKFESFCCGCSLQMGTIIIGWVELTYNLIDMYISSIIAQNLAKIEFDFQPFAKFPYAMYVDSAIMAALKTFFALVVLIGAYKKNPNFLYAWLITVLITWSVVTFMSILFYVSACVIMVIYSYRSYTNFGAVAVLIVGKIIVIPLELYFWLVVYSYRSRLKKANRDVTPSSSAANRI